MPNFKIRFFIISVIACALCLLNVFNAVAATQSLASPFDSHTDTEDPLKAPESPVLEYDPCLMTAYGEPVYDEGSLDEYLQNLDLEAEYQRARMAFLFGNYEYAYKVWEPLAFQGYAKAQATLAWMFHTGKGVRKNMKRALAWYRVAADKDHAIAQNNLGVFYEQGIEVGKSYRLAARWYKKAAEVGYSYAQYNLGMLYLKGKGVKKNKNEAIYWLQIAALQGVKQADQLLIKLGERSAPKDKAHEIKPKRKYHGSPVPTRASLKNNTENTVYSEHWIAQQNPTYYTLQIAGSDNLNSLLKLASTIHTNADLAYFELPYKGKSWYSLIYGRFKDKTVASKAIDNLPDNIKKWAPMIRQFSDVQKYLTVETQAVKPH